MGEVIDSFDSTADLSGAITDDITDPPFTIDGLEGPATASQQIVSLAFGNAFLGSVHGIKYVDRDRSSTYDPSIDRPMAGVTITLTGDVDGDGITDTLTTVTDANGEYGFTDLFPGTYTVEETPPPGSTPTTATKVTVTVGSGEEIVAVPGQAGITDPNDPRHEVPGARALARELGCPGQPEEFPNAELVHVFETELLSMDLAGEGLMPLGAGLGNVNSRIEIHESAALASPGVACVWSADPAGTPTNSYFIVDSFFDVFFDITVTDIDPLNDFGGQPDEAVIALAGVGPAKMRSTYQGTPPADNLQPPPFNFLPPPEEEPYIGHEQVIIPLDDIGLDGFFLKFTVVSHEVDGENRTYIELPNGEVIDSFDSAADLTGAITDDITDPPFAIQDLKGPASASQQIVSLAFGNYLPPGSIHGFKYEDVDRNSMYDAAVDVRMPGRDDHVDRRRGRRRHDRHRHHRDGCQRRVRLHGPFPGHLHGGRNAAGRFAADHRPQGDGLGAPQ